VQVDDTGAPMAVLKKPGEQRVQLVAPCCDW
jgi:hypothetical protein